MSMICQLDGSCMSPKSVEPTIALQDLQLNPQVNKLVGE